MNPTTAVGNKRSTRGVSTGKKIHSPTAEMEIHMPPTEVREPRKDEIDEGRYDALLTSASTDYTLIYT